MSAHLHIHHPDPDGSTFDLHEEIISVGRNPENSLHLDHPSVSGRHAELISVDGRFRITDLESTNGTWLHDCRISSVELSNGDELRFGDLRATYFSEPASQDTAPANIALAEPPSLRSDTEVETSRPSESPARWHRRHAAKILTLCVTLALVGLISLKRKNHQAVIETSTRPMLDRGSSLAKTVTKIPPSWLAPSSEARSLIKTVKRIFDLTGSDVDALQVAIERVDGLEAKEAGTAERILDTIARAGYGMEHETTWRLFAKVQERWRSLGFPGACPYFLADQFVDSIIGVQVISKIRKRDLDWSSNDAESMLLRHFDDVCWAAKQEEVQHLVAFGSILDDDSWQAARTTRLRDGKPLEKSLEILRQQVENENCFAIEFTLEYILENIPRGFPLSERGVSDKSNVLTADDFERAYNRSLLPKLGSLHGRSFRADIDGSIANAFRREEVAPEELKHNKYISKLTGDFDSLGDFQRPEKIQQLLAREFPQLPSSEVRRLSGVFVNAARAAIKEATSK